MEVSHFSSLSLAYWVTLSLLVVAMLAGWWRQRGTALQAQDVGLPAAGLVDVVLVVLLALLNGFTFVIGESAVADAGGKEPVVTTAQFAGNALFQINLAMLLVLYLRLVRGVSPVSFLGLRERSLGAVLAGAVGGLWVTYLLMQLAMVAWWHGVLGMAPPKDSDQVVVQVFQQSKDEGLRAAIMVSAGLVAPLTEELTYRGLIYGFARSLMGHWPAAILSSALFSLVHVDAVASLPLFVLALGLATAYHRSRTLWVPILMHMLFNAWNLAAMLME